MSFPIYIQNWISEDGEFDDVPNDPPEYDGDDDYYDDAEFLDVEQLIRVANNARDAEWKDTVTRKQVAAIVNEYVRQVNELDILPLITEVK